MLESSGSSSTDSSLILKELSSETAFASSSSSSSTSPHFVFSVVGSVFSAGIGASAEDEDASVVETFSTVSAIVGCESERMKKMKRNSVDLSIDQSKYVFLFINSKCKHYFHNKLKPSKLAWTTMYRKQHKKDAAQEAVKKRRRATKKPYSRSIVGATLEVIQKKRAEKPEVRDAAREAALRDIKERIKKTKDEKKAKKAEFASKQQKIQAKIPKAAAKGGPKLGGGGGKR
ncbi:hypothetical protein F2Q68_00044836 [Brassica cretica]|uniref:Large ribosomal subunit protein eL24-related N-terminal domain-containing protein n=1 Tax=Brassica cretica TaxID=69181 RepID=A0A8S9LGZ9_BRACR|nr:hypothetical protein F2Q68_00044836 [Brassica cretica]